MKNINQTRPKFSSKTFHKCLNRYSENLLGVKLNKQIQIVLDKPQYILKGEYITKTGKRIIESITSLGQIPDASIFKKYTKKRYILNNAKPIKTIVH